MLRCVVAVPRAIKVILRKDHFFCVPKNKIMRQQWQAAVRRKDVELTEKHYVCENHFHPSSIIWQKLLKDADGNVIGVGAKTQIPRLEPFRLFRLLSHGLNLSTRIS